MLSKSLEVRSKDNKINKDSKFNMGSKVNQANKDKVARSEVMSWQNTVVPAVKLETYSIMRRLPPTEDNKLELDTYFGYHWDIFQNLYNHPYIILKHHKGHVYENDLIHQHVKLYLIRCGVDLFFFKLNRIELSLVEFGVVYLIVYSFRVFDGLDSYYHSFVDTDYYNEVPETGVTREYWFDLQEVTVAPDGIERIALTVNGTIPGPTIEADWGDNVVVHVTNNLASSMNGTSIHFHGIRQNYTNQHDGVVSITQCPTAPGSNYTYTWRATQYGTTWYHSHFALQAWEGVFGGIKINGPATANYDVDLGHVFLNDWSHETSSSLEIVSESQGPPTLENALINGTNVYNDSGVVTGSRFETTWEAGTSYRLRLVSGAIDTQFKFSVDNHTMLVIANDLVPIVPYNTTVLNIGMGQRYDVIITADQESIGTDFWMRAIPQTACSNNDNPDNIKGIVRYSTSISSDDPETTGYEYTNECVDEAMSDLVPYLSKNAESGTSLLEAVTLGRNTDNYNRWYMNSTSMVVEWNNPSLLQVYENDTMFTDTSGVVRLDTANEWVVFVIDTTMPVPHPIHLHGHDFNVLAQGTGTYDSSVTLNLDNPPRRDVAMLPSAGYLVIAFETDNPGAWLMHCHIGWHTSEGFAIQILERWDEIEPLIDYDVLEDNCNAWDSYVEANSVEQDDSGV
ncbi:putative multicopper oxidase [Diplodia seriata]|uniref:laccase n=1 Tax=Diplodia seriata TaxID=420778 RepID=A0A0G2EIM8_9PEZI|nr:putative multicopper oxidase [Diplodia seriata]